MNTHFAHKIVKLAIVVCKFVTLKDLRLSWGQKMELKSRSTAQSAYE